MTMCFLISLPTVRGPRERATLHADRLPVADPPQALACLSVDHHLLWQPRPDYPVPVSLPPRRGLPNQETAALAACTSSVAPL